MGVCKGNCCSFLTFSMEVSQPLSIMAVGHPTMAFEGGNGATFAILSPRLSRFLTTMYEVVLALPKEMADSLSLPRGDGSRG